MESENNKEKIFLNLLTYGWDAIKILLFFLVDQVVLLIAVIARRYSNFNNNHDYLPLYLFIALAIAVIFFLGWRYHQQLKNNQQTDVDVQQDNLIIKYNPHFPNWQNMTVILLSIIAIIAMEIIIGLIDSKLHIQKASHSTNQQLLNVLIHHSPLIMFIESTIIAPFMEEFIFRGFFFNYFFKHAKGLRMFLGIIINGCLFGLLHEQTHLLIWITYSLLGIILACAYQYTRNIYVPIIIHMINNMMAFFI